MPAVRVISALQGLEVFCRDKAGIFEGSIIRCKCCNKEYAPSAFEHHSGSSFRRPWKSIKDANGKSIQEYREEQERAQETEAMTTSPNEEVFVVERVLASRVRQGLKEYLVKWENYDDSHNSWIPPENFGDRSLLAQYEGQNREEKKRKLAVEAGQGRKVPRGMVSQVSPHKSGSLEASDHDSSPPYSPPNTVAHREDCTASPPSATGEMPPFEKDLLYEPFDGEANPASLLLGDVDDYLDLSEPSDSEDEDEPQPITTVTVDYQGMRVPFIGVSTYMELLEKALDYWAINSLTSPKDWNLTSNKGNVWPLGEEISRCSPEVVYLRRKPWR